jgi:hypothetical protein
MPITRAGLIEVCSSISPTQLGLDPLYICEGLEVQQKPNAMQREGKLTAASASFNRSSLYPLNP